MSSHVTRKSPPPDRPLASPKHPHKPSQPLHETTPLAGSKRRHTEPSLSADTPPKKTKVQEMPKDEDVVIFEVNEEEDADDRSVSAESEEALAPISFGEYVPVDLDRELQEYDDDDEEEQEEKEKEEEAAAPVLQGADEAKDEEGEEADGDLEAMMLAELAGPEQQDPVVTIPTGSSASSAISDAKTKASKDERKKKAATAKGKKKAATAEAILHKQRNLAANMAVGGKFGERWAGWSKAAADEEKTEKSEGGGSAATPITIEDEEKPISPSPSSLEHPQASTKPKDSAPSLWKTHLEYPAGHPFKSETTFEADPAYGKAAVTFGVNSTEFEYGKTSAPKKKEKKYTEQERKGLYHMEELEHRMTATDKYIKWLDGLTSEEKKAPRSIILIEHEPSLGQHEAERWVAKLAQLPFNLRNRARGRSTLELHVDITANETNGQGLSLNFYKEIERLQKNGKVKAKVVLGDVSLLDKQPEDFFPPMDKFVNIHSIEPTAQDLRKQGIGREEAERQATEKVYSNGHMTWEERCAGIREAFDWLDDWVGGIEDDEDEEAARQQANINGANSNGANSNGANVYAVAGNADQPIVIGDEEL